MPLKYTLLQKRCVSWSPPNRFETRQSIHSFIRAQRLLHNVERTQQSAEWVILTQINSIIHREVLCFQALLGGAHPHSTGARCGLQFSKVEGNTSIVQKNQLATEMLSDEYSFF